MASALQETAGRACPRATIQAPGLETPADRDRPGTAQGGRARRAGALEGAPPRSSGSPGARGCAGRFDAWPLVHLDPYPPEPGARAGQAPAGSGTARSGREDLIELIGGRDLELVVAAVTRLLVRAPAKESRGVAKAVTLQVVVLDLDDPLDAQRFPREIL